MTSDTQAQQVCLATRPDGLPGAEHLRLVRGPVPAPGTGEVLVRNRYFHVSTAVRILIAGATHDTPFPPLHPGDPLVGAAIGEVVATSDGGPPVGQLVHHWRGWRDYATVPVSECEPLGGDLPDPVAYLSQGWTAYAALTRAAPPRPGDTVFVTGGGSAIGAMAGQLARLLGAGRVIGSTGSPAKARRLVEELGYDAAVVRGAEPLAAQLAKAAPDGLDLVFDNVGGEQLAAAIEAARTGCRVVLVGALAGQLDPRGTGTSAPVTLDSLRLIHRRVQLRGFSSDDAQGRSEWHERFGAWLRQGALSFQYTLIDGLEFAPKALQDLIEGRHLGTVIARV